MYEEATPSIGISTRVNAKRNSEIPHETTESLLYQALSHNCEGLIQYIPDGMGPVFDKRWR
jgi:hypothetical protein